MIHQFMELNSLFFYCTCGEWSVKSDHEEAVAGFQTHMGQLAGEAERLRLDPRAARAEAMRARRPIR